MSEKQKVEIAGGTFWLGLMAFIVAIQSCDIKDSAVRIERLLEERLPSVVEVEDDG